MSFLMNSSQYIDYIHRAAKKIAENKEYISELDAVTGDGDHWANLNLGFENLIAEGGQIRQMPMDAAFMKIGMIMMSKIGGSSGILYGGAYMAAGRAISGKAEITSEELCKALDVMVQDMMERGKAKPGYKTMIDALYPAVEAYKKALEEGLDNHLAMQMVKKAAKDGAEATRGMEAVKGRASYQTGKGIGCLDPGAVTMSYQIECLCDYISETFCS